jgi:NADP-reducing hydrogenase subunit HndA
MGNTTLTPQQETKLREIITEYKDVPGALLPVLEKAQEARGYLPMEALEIIANGLELPLSKVAGTAGFYSFLSSEKCGRYVIRMCKSAPCHVNGAAATLKALEDTLGIKVGETAPDGRFTLQTVDCLGLCDKAPSVMVNDEAFGPVFSEDVPEFLAGFENKRG